MFGETHGTTSIRFTSRNRAALITRGSPIRIPEIKVELHIPIYRREKSVWVACNQMPHHEAKSQYIYVMAQNANIIVSTYVLMTGGCFFAVQK